MARRGFTMMETMMAAALGAAVVLACVGVFASMSRTDRVTALRFEQTSALSRVHLVMTRAFGNIVMSDTSVTGGPGAQLSAQEAGEIAGVRPRILLEPDKNPSLERSLSRAGIEGGGRPQRLEMVVSKAPVPALMTSTRGEAMAMAAHEPSVYAGPALRGVFELRPDLSPQRAKALGVPGLDPRRSGYTLWWRPLPHEAQGAAGSLFTLEPEEDPGAVPIASGLEKCSWLAFSKRERKSGFRALQFQDLPAYMEMEVRTTTGLTANWMFEVDWTNGPETTEELESKELAAPDGGAVAAMGGAGAAGAGGGTRVSPDGSTTTIEGTDDRLGRGGKRR